MTPFEISEQLTEDWADLSPIGATEYGIPGRDHLVDDFSPEGYAARADLYREARDRLAPHLEQSDSRQARTAKILLGWLESRIESHENGQWRRDLNHIYSPFQLLRDVFDVMPQERPEDWENIIARLNGFPTALVGHRASLLVGIEVGDVVARRQAESVLEQAEEVAAEDNRYVRYPAEAKRAGADPDRVAEAVLNARMACEEFAAWLRHTYLPAARAQDAIGEESYNRGVERFLGMQLDLEETYRWGWEEVHRLRDEMRVTAAAIEPHSSVDEVIEMLDTDPSRAAATRGEFVEFVSQIQQTAVEQLDGDHFDVPEELKTVSVNMAPPGGALGAWYHGPSEDFSRPGSIWYAPGERKLIPYWQEVSTAYHEGFPGHHLQVGTAIMQREKLSRFERAVVWYSGAGEGWALYAERLMDELGFFEKPEYRLGLLASQLFRATRVVVDIGCQLEKSIPAHAPLYSGEQWSYDRAVDYMNQVGLQARDVAESEVKRYLGWAAQAISYKVGEREILDIRRHLATSQEFDRKDFHRRILEAGAIRLDHLRQEMT
ncbi:MAG: DUF885 domain-containing protein [Acidimicrobiia bacterium]|nr:DUF885 domain-containing protein [Acidimicrobiia bacterium]